MTLPHPERPRLLARQMAFAFSAVSILAAAMCGVLLVIISNVSGLVAGMRHDEVSIRQGLELATTVRELSRDISTAVIEGREVDLGRYEQRRNQLRTHIQELSARIPEREHWHLQALGENTQRMHDLLLGSALPAMRSGKSDEVRQVHRQLASLGDEAATHADALANTTASQMAHAHVMATDATRLGLIGGGVFVFLVISLSIWFTVRLRAAVLKPLVALTHAARDFGNGNFDRRVGQVGQGEFAELSDAFDHMAEELAHREARLVHNGRMAAIGQLAAGIAHELNNPIGIIRGYLKTMSPDGPTETLREELAILDEEAAHCQRIAEDLLSYARTEELAVASVDIAAIIRQTVLRFRESSVAGGQVVRVEAAATHVWGDSARLRQVLLNLLNNAAQASPEHGEIVVRGQVCGEEYEISVADSGPGVAPADRVRIFEPFFTKRPGGSGLGLAVCLGIIQAHHGAIEVVEGPCGGATFRMYLPLTQPAEQQ
ncbi:MAG: ATP-binding protein [Nannocystaceae bacterium]